MTGFAPGRLVVHRNLRHGRLGWVRPCRVVSDDPRGLLLWLAARSPVANEVAQDGRGMRDMPFAEWVTLPYRLHVAPWRGPGVLMLTPPDAAHSVWWFFTDSGEFAERLGFPSHYWVRDEAPVRAEGARVVKLIEAGEFPFDGTWCDFRPDPQWTVPAALPDGWDRRG